jgi:hypothetical protein
MDAGVVKLLIQVCCTCRQHQTQGSATCVTGSAGRARLQERRRRRRIRQPAQRQAVRAVRALLPERRSAALDVMGPASGLLPPWPAARPLQNPATMQRQQQRNWRVASTMLSLPGTYSAAPAQHGRAELMWLLLRYKVNDTCMVTQNGLLCRAGYRAVLANAVRLAATAANTQELLRAVLSGPQPSPQQAKEQERTLPVESGGLQGFVMKPRYS